MHRRRGGRRARRAAGYVIHMKEFGDSPSSAYEQNGQNVLSLWITEGPINLHIQAAGRDATEVLQNLQTLNPELGKLAKFGVDIKEFVRKQSLRAATGGQGLRGDVVRPVEEAQSAGREGRMTELPAYGR